MNITDTELLYLTGYSVLLGGVLAVCYGLFAFLRILVSPISPVTAGGRALCDVAAFITDVLYSLFAGICVALMFFGLNSGRVRFMGIVGCGAGFCIYHFTVGRWLIRRMCRCIGKIRGVIRYVYSHTVGAVIRLIKRAFKKVFDPFIQRRKSLKAQKSKRKAKNEKLEFLG